jgi:exonuclease SbcD
VHEHWVQRGDVTIAYPGNLQGRHIRELGERGALLVTAQDGDITAVERLAVDVLRWHLLDIDIAPVADGRSAVRLVGQALERLLSDTPAHLPLAVRVVFKGRSAAHADLVADEGQLPHEVLQATPELSVLRQDPAAQVPERIRQATPVLMARVGQDARASATASANTPT